MQEPDEDLVDLLPRDLLHPLHVIGAVRHRDHRLERGQVDVDHPFVLRRGVRLELHVGLFAPLGLEERLGHLVGGEDRGGHAELGAHVRDRGALGDRQRLHAVAAVLHDRADVPLRRKDLQQLEDDVLGRHPRLEFPGEVHLDHPRIRHVEGTARHRHGDVQPPRSDRHHPDAASRRGVRVGAQHRLAGGPEPLDVDLVADAVPGAGVEDPVLRGDRLQVQVVVGVLEPFLQRVVIDVGDRPLGLHPGNPHRLELQVRHRSGRVLGEGLVDPDGHLLARLLVTGYVVRIDDLLDDVLSHRSSPPSRGVLSSAIRTKSPCVDSIR